MVKEFTPKEIVEQLDKYIIGQDNAKKAVAVALRNRIRRQKLSEDMREEVTPKNILMIGPTGVGKTEIARRLAKLVKAPFIKVEASKFTEVGYVGRDVESIVKDLMQSGVNMVRDDHMAMVRAKAESLVEDRILDLLVPPVRQQKKTMLTEEEIEQQKQEGERFKETREKFRQQLRRGEMEEKFVEISVRPKQQPMFEIMSGQSMEDIGMGLQDMMDNLSGAKMKRKMAVQKQGL